MAIFTYNTPKGEVFMQKRNSVKAKERQLNLIDNKTFSTDIKIISECYESYKFCINCVFNYAFYLLIGERQIADVMRDAIEIEHRHLIEYINIVRKNSGKDISLINLSVYSFDCLKNYCLFHTGDKKKTLLSTISDKILLLKRYERINTKTFSKEINNVIAKLKRESEEQIQKFFDGLKNF